MDNRFMRRNSDAFYIPSKEEIKKYIETAGKSQANVDDHDDTQDKASCCGCLPKLFKR